jgi:hypothetical protein
MGQRKTLRQILELLPELVKDVRACEESLIDGKQYARRSYVRSLLAMIEGTVHCIKELEFAELYARERPHIPTLVALKEVVFDIDKHGKVKENVKYVNSASNLLFVVNMFYSIFKKQLDLGIGTSKWDNFKTAIKIRNRITHPKETGDLTVSETELSVMKDVNEWFNGIIKDVIEHVANYYK